nr:putative gpi-anchored protein [Quercus suber]
MCAEDEDNLLQGINSYRNSLNRPALIKNEKADCLADEIANELEDEPCTSPTNGATIKPSSTTQLPDLPKHFKKCRIDVNTTVNGIILPVCVPKLVPTIVLTNYTRTANAKYINSSKYTLAGFGAEDDWMVTVLGTNTTGGSFSSAISLVSEPKTEPKSSLSDTDSLLQKLHSAAYTTAIGDDAEEHEHEHHLGEHGFHHVVWSEAESLHGPPSDVGCSQPIHRELTFPPSVLPESDQNPDSNNTIGFGFGFEFPSFSMELMAVPKRKEL